MLQNPFQIIADDEEGEVEKKEKDRPSPLGERLAERFLDSRQIFLWGAVHDRSAQMIVERMLFDGRSELAQSRPVKLPRG